MKAWTKDQRNQLNVELRGQQISAENVQSSTNDDDLMPTSNPPIFSSPHNTQNTGELLGPDHSGYRNMRQRPMSCKPRSIPAKRRFRQQGFSSSNESLSGSEMTGNKSNKEKAIAVAWAEKDYQSNDVSKEINDRFPSVRMFQKRDQKEKILFDNGINEGLGETQLFHANAFPARRMTMSLQHQSSAKGKKTPLTTASSSKNNQSQGGETSLERHKCVIPVPSRESTVYDSIDTERLLRLNLSDPELISQLQEELISRHAGENRKHLSIMAPPSSPRAGSPTFPVDSCFSAQKGTNNADIFSNHSDININTTSAECPERQATSSPKNSSVINLCDVSTAPSSPRSSSIVAQNTEEQMDKSLESDRRDNKPLHVGCASSGEEGVSEKEPMTDVRVRSVQLLCTHSGRLRHSATLVESYPMTFPSKYQLSEKEGTKGAPMAATNKVFVSKSNYKPIKVVYEEKEQCKPQETGIPVTVPHLQRYLSNLQKKQMKLKETRGMTPQGRTSSLAQADGIYKTTKTYEFGPQGPQEIVQKTLICKNSSNERRPKTSNSTPAANKVVWKTRPQSGPSRFLTNQNIVRKTSSTKVFGGDKPIKKKENQNLNKKEPKQPEVTNKLQNSLEDDDDSSHLSIDLPSNQIIPRVHFESKMNNRSVPLNSILKKGSQENQLINSLESEPKEKAQVLNIPESNTTFEHLENIPENNEKTTSISEELPNPKFNNTSIDKYENDHNKVTKSQTGILFNGIGASSDFGRIKDVSPRETQKPIEREASVILTSTKKDLDTTVNVSNKSDSEEKKRVSFHQQKCDSLLSTKPPQTENSLDKEKTLVKEREKNNSNNFFQELKNSEISELKEKESDYYLTTTRYIQTDKKETSSNTLPASKDYNSNRRLSGSFSIYRSSVTDSLSKTSALNTSQKETQPQSTKVKSERKSGSSKKGKSSKGRSRPKSSKPTGPPVYLTTVKAQNPIDEDDFECEQLSDKLMEHGVYVSWKTIRGGLYPPTGRSLHYEIADTGLIPPSDLLSHPRNWFPKEYKELQRATKNLERAELALWKQKRAEEKKFGSKRKRKLTKKKKK